MLLQRRWKPYGQGEYEYQYGQARNIGNGKRRHFSKNRAQTVGLGETAYWRIGNLAYGMAAAVARHELQTALHRRR